MKSQGRSLAQLTVVVLTMAVLIAVTGSSSSSQSISHTGLYQPVEGETASRVESLFTGVPQQGAALGSPRAPVTLQFFADLECEEARLFVLGALPFLIRNWVRKGDLRIVYRANPEETIWDEIFNHQQVATLAAGMQGKGWNYLDFFYHEQGPEFTRYATNHFLQAIAGEVRGLDIPKWTRDRRQPALTDHVVRDRVVARHYSIGYTPAFMIGPTGGAAEPLLHFSLTESVAFDEAIEAILKSRA